MKKSRRLLGIVLIIAIILTQLLAVVPASAAEATTDFIDTFEKATTDSLAERATNIEYTSGSVSIAEETDGNKYLKVSKTETTDDDWKPAISLRDINGNSYTKADFVAGTTYNFLLTFKYKVESGSGLDTYIKPRFGPSGNGSEFSNYDYTKSLTGTPFVVGSSTASSDYTNGYFYGNGDGNWHTVGMVMSITPVIDSGWAFDFYLAIENAAGSANTIGLDDISIEYIGDGVSASSIRFNTNGSKNFDVISGVVGTQAAIPTPENLTNGFSGWYTDAEMTEKFNGVFPAEDIVLYAEWPFTDDFEHNNAVKFLNESGEAVTPTVKTEADGNNALNISSAAATKFIMWMQSETGATYTLPSPMVSGKEYKFIIQFKYKIESIGWNEGLYIRTARAMATGQATVQTSYALLANSYNRKDPAAMGPWGVYQASIDNQWHTASLPATFSGTNGWQSLGLEIETGGEVSLWFDDITVIPVEESATIGSVLFNTNGGDALSVVSGVVGSDYEMPIPVKAGSEFVGWYTDAGFTTPYNGKFPANSTDASHTLFYAKWIFKDTFQNATTDDLTSDIRCYVYDADSSNGTVKIEEEADGNKYLSFENNEGTAYTAYLNLRSEDNQSYGYTFTADTQYKFLVSFKYKFISKILYGEKAYIEHYFTPYTTGQNFANWSNQSTFIGGGLYVGSATDPKVDANPGFNLGIGDGEWHTATQSMEFTPNASWGCSFTLKISMPATTYATVCIDDVTIEPVASDATISTIFYDPNGGETVERSAGIAGTEVNLPVAEKENAEFIGWYTDAAMTEKFGGTFPNENITLYAKYKVHSIYDYNNDGKIDIIDLVNLKKKAIEEPEKYNADKLVTLRKILLNPDFVSKKVGNETYTLTWNDEFDNVNTDTWNIASTQATTNSDGYAVSYSADNVTVKDGSAVLSMSADSSAKTSSAVKIDTQGKMQYKYGYLEARVKGTAKSVNSCMWLNGAGIGKKHMEIDLIETFGLEDQFATNIHFWNGGETDTTSMNYHRNFSDILSSARTQTIKNITSDYYTIGMLWTPEKFEFYLNGKLYLSATMAELQAAVAECDYEDILKTPLYLIFDAGAATNHNSSSWTANNSFAYPFTIDYVRLYQNVEQAELTVK